jgi:hypothetical protein
MGLIFYRKTYRPLRPLPLTLAALKRPGERVTCEHLCLPPNTHGTSQPNKAGSKVCEARTCLLSDAYCVCCAHGGAFASRQTWRRGAARVTKQNIIDLVFVWAQFCTADVTRSMRFIPRDSKLIRQLVE